MKKTLIPVSFVLTAFVADQAQAGDIFLQSRVERTRRCVPQYDYQATRASAVSAVLSESAIVMVTTATANPADTTAVKVQQTSRAFVFDELKAGPLMLTGLSAKTDSTGRIRVTGILNHSGGDTGQLLGGKAVIRIEPLTATGTSARNATGLGLAAKDYWIRRNQPEPVGIDVGYENTYPYAFGEVERVRVFLEYHPSR